MCTFHITPDEGAFRIHIKMDKDIKKQLPPRFWDTYLWCLKDIAYRETHQSTTWPGKCPDLPDWSAYSTAWKIALLEKEKWKVTQLEYEHKKWYLEGPRPECPSCKWKRFPDLLSRLTAMDRRWEEESRERARRWTLLRRQVKAFVEDPASSAHLQVAKGNFWSKKYGWHVRQDRRYDEEDGVWSVSDWWLTPDGRLVTLDMYDTPYSALDGPVTPELAQLKDIPFFETLLRELFKRCSFTPPQQ